MSYMNVIGTQAFLPLPDNRDIVDFPIGDSVFSDDEWDLTSIVADPSISRSRKVISFSYIQNPEMREVVKRYAYFCLSRIKIVSVRGKINSCLPMFFDYCKTNHIYSFRDITLDAFIGYSKYLRDDLGYKENSGYQASYVVEEILKVGNRKNWPVARISFAEINSRTLWCRGSSTKKATEALPDFVLNQIVHHAKYDEKDPITRAAILIQSQTGLRINEVLKLKFGCVHRDNYGMYLTTQIIKTAGQDPVEHHVYLNEVALEAIYRLEAETAQLRIEAETDDLFIFRSRNDKKIYHMTNSNFQTNRVRNFIERWSITDQNGNLFFFHTHQFRATFAQKVIQSGFSIDYIRQQFGHVSLEMTMHYLNLSSETVKSAYAEMVLSPDAKIAGKNAETLQTKLSELFKGKTAAEIDATIETLSRTISFNPLPSGICLYNTYQNNCTNGDGCFFYNCPNFVTSTKFLPVLRKELDLLEKEMDRCKSANMEREWQRHFIIWKELSPLVTHLEDGLNEKS